MIDRKVPMEPLPPLPPRFARQMKRIIRRNEPHYGRAAFWWAYIIALSALFAYLLK